MLTRVCPQCGKADLSPGAESFVGSFCRSCFLSRQKLFSFPDLEVVLCPRCERFRLSGLWRRPSAFLEYLRGKIRSPYPIRTMEVAAEKQAKLVACVLSLTLDVQGADVKIEDRLSFPLVKELCHACALKSSGYHEAVVQVRGENQERVRQKAESMRKALVKKTFISKIVEDKNGVDLWVGDKKVLFGLLAGEKYSISQKLVGEKKGKRIYRPSLCLRV